ncbi:Tn3 family transposase [Candidatus Sodalis endolongispinus]|uniref:Tn3 family transposase n=1 Tax=Candidatus Sodalis endolongispinus TaxID=2812662 RepID=A0ABS5YBK0_9GAMM|nr:Tn3 family transposase [Candidatus Sodalis endolongispinus]
MTALLLEIDAHNGFAGAFFPASEASANLDDLPVGISTLLLAEGCDSGLEPLISSPNSALRWRRLDGTKTNNLLTETNMATGEHRRRRAHGVHWRTVDPVTRSQLICAEQALNGSDTFTGFTGFTGKCLIKW